MNWEMLMARAVMWDVIGMVPSKLIKCLLFSSHGLERRHARRQTRQEPRPIDALAIMDDAEGTQKRRSD